MHEVTEAVERRSRVEKMTQIGLALHDLCQPLTTLQCRLELAGMIGTAEAYREAVDLGLAECLRLVDSVGSMREIVLGAIREAKAEESRMVR